MASQTPEKDAEDMVKDIFYAAGVPLSMSMLSTAATTGTSTPTRPSVKGGGPSRASAAAAANERIRMERSLRLAAYSKSREEAMRKAAAGVAARAAARAAKAASTGIGGRPKVSAGFLAAIAGAAPSTPYVILPHGPGEMVVQHSMRNPRLRYRTTRPLGLRGHDRAFRKRKLAQVLKAMPPGQLYDTRMVESHRLHAGQMAFRSKELIPAFVYNVIGPRGAPEAPDDTSYVFIPTGKKLPAQRERGSHPNHGPLLSASTARHAMNYVTGAV